MIVKMVHGTNYDDMATVDIYVDGKLQVSVYPLNDCPEDAFLERDLRFTYDIPTLMRRLMKRVKTERISFSKRKKKSRRTIVCEKYREFLLKAQYPTILVAKMTDEEVVGEYEVITGESADVTPVY